MIQNCFIRGERESGYNVTKGWYKQIELYQYDTNSISKIEFIQVIRAFITTERKIIVYNMVYNNESQEYIRHRIK